MRSVALVVRFLLEVAVLVALVATGVLLVGGVLGTLAGLALAGIAAFAWGMFVAPRARIALPTPARLAVEVAVFAAGVGGLLLAGAAVLAAVLGGGYLLDRLALLVSGAPPFEAGAAPGRFRA